MPANKNQSNLVKYEYGRVYKELVEVICECVPHSAFHAKRIHFTALENGETNMSFDLTPSEASEYFNNILDIRQRIFRYVQQRQSLRYLDTYQITPADVRAYIQAKNAGLIEGDMEWQTYLESYYNEIQENYQGDFPDEYDFHDESPI